MLTQIINENLVIAAKSFNPSIFSQLWLIKQGIMFESDFTDQAMFSPIAADVRAKQFHLLVIPDRLQFTFARNAVKKDALIRQVPYSIVNNLPHTPYIAIGFNIRIIFTPEDNDNFLNKTKMLLLSSYNPLTDAFNGIDARYGFYCSSDFSGMRLRLDVKPNSAIDTSGNKLEFLSFEFNYNKDLIEDNKVEQIFAFLADWDKAEKHCFEIMQKFELEWNKEK
jgi:hypothetical protein